jgi:hypothetical protein
MMFYICTLGHEEFNKFGFTLLLFYFILLLILEASADLKEKIKLRKNATEGLVRPNSELWPSWGRGATQKTSPVWSTRGWTRIL